MQLKELKQEHPLIYNRILDYMDKQTGTRLDHFDVEVCHNWTTTTEGATFWNNVIGPDGNLEKFYEKYPRENYLDGIVTDSLGGDSKQNKVAQVSAPEPIDDISVISDGDHVKGSDDDTEKKTWTNRTLFFRGQTKAGLFITEDTEGCIKTFKHIEKLIVGKDQLKAFEIMEKYIPESKKSHPASETFKVKSGTLVEMLKEVYNSK